MLHTDDHLELGDNVLLTHGAVIHGGKVGSNVLVGVNAVLLEDADVGDYVFIGAGRHRARPRAGPLAGHRRAGPDTSVESGAGSPAARPHRQLRPQRPEVHSQRPRPANPVQSPIGPGNSG